MLGSDRGVHPDQVPCAEAGTEGGKRQATSGVSDDDGGIGEADLARCLVYGLGQGSGGVLRCSEIDGLDAVASCPQGASEAIPT